MRPLPHAQSGSSTILVNKFNTGCLERLPYDFQGSPARLPQTGFELMHGYYADTRCSCKVVLIPAKETARCSALRCRNHSPQLCRNCAIPANV
jgi:hypothetical protein